MIRAGRAATGNRWFFLLLAAGLLAPSPAHAQNQLDPPDRAIEKAPVLQYRRVFVPADRPDDWPAGDAQYLPVTREEFERLVQFAEDRCELAAAGVVHIESAQYVARLDESGVLRGRATLRISLLDGQPRLLELAPLNISLANVRWLGAADNSVAPAAGAWSRGDAGKFGVMVRNNGELHLDWGTTPSAASASGWDYSLKLPTATASQLELTLPTGVEASISPGYQRLGLPQTASTNARQVFQLGPGDEHIVRIRRAPATATGYGSPLHVAVSETLQVRSAGLDYEAELRVQSSTAASDLALKVVGDLRITDVTVDNRCAHWRSDGDDSSILLISLPKSPLPTNVTIRGAALAILDSPWQLPTVVPRSAHWTEGACTLWVDQALELKSIEPTGARLINSVGIGGSGGRGEAYRLQAWSEGAVTTVTLGERRLQLAGRVGTIAEFADRDVLAKTQFQLWCEGGEVYQLTASLQPDWTIESIDSTASDEVLEWHVTDHDAERRLHAQLRRSPTAVAPLQLSITARKPIRGWARQATVNELDWIKLIGADFQAQYLLVRDREGAQVVSEQLSSAGFINAAELDAGSRDMLDRPTQGLLLDLAKADRSDVLRVPRLPVRFAAEGQFELTKTPMGFEHRATVMCQPEYGAVSELTFVTARPLPGDARWSLSDGDKPLTAERTPVPDDAGTGKQFSQYRVRLPYPEIRPFELRIAWRGSDPRHDSINSFAVPGASSWQSWAILRGDAGEVSVEGNDFLPAAAIPESPTDQAAAPVLACYRLSDDPYAPLVDAPALSERGTTPLDYAPLTCWLQEIATLQFDDGRQSHRITFHLESPSVSRARITLPSGGDLLAVRLDGELIDSTRRQDGEEVAVLIPGNRGKALLVVELVQRRGPLGNICRVSPPQIKTSFAVLQSRWILSAPSHFVADDAHASTQRQDDPLMRLFGPLLRRPHVSAGGDLLARARADGPTLSPGAAGYAPPGSLAPDGWTTIAQDFVRNAEEVTLTHVGSRRAAWYVSWLAAALIAARALPRFPRALLTLTFVAAILALALPAGYGSWPQALFLGVLSGVIAGMLSRMSCRIGARATARVAAGCLAGAIVLLSTSAISQADDEAVGVPSSVLYPIDRYGKPVGDDLYVPGELLSKLLPSRSSSLRDGSTSVLLEANYRFDINPVPQGRNLICTAGSLRFRWRTFASNVFVHLPLAQRDANWLGERHMLDGAAVQLGWDDPDGCKLVLARPGFHELVLELLPRTSRVGDRVQIAIHVPSFPAGRLEVKHPAGIKIEAPSAITDQLASNATKTVALLADQPVLECSWPAYLPQADDELLLLEQLTWLSVEPASSTLEVRLDLVGGQPSQDTLTLAVSPELKLLPLPDSSPVYVLQTYSGAPSIVELKFHSPPKLPLSLSLRFQVQRTASLGQFHLPRVRLSGARATLHHFVVSADGALRLRDKPGPGVSPTTAGEITARWPGLPPTELRYSVDGEFGQWSMRVEQAPLRLAASETMAMMCDEDGVEFAYFAQVRAVEGEVLIHRLTIPAELGVISAAVELAGVENRAPMRWSRPRADQLELFLGRPLAEPHAIRLVGRFSYADGRQLQVPRILLTGAAASPIQVAVTRASSVLVDADASIELSDDYDFPGEVELRGLPTARFQMGRNDDVPPRLYVRPNDVQQELQFLLELNTSPKPSAACILHGEVVSGVADTVELVADRSWHGPFSTDGGITVTERPIPYDNSARIIVLQLHTPVAAGGSFTVRFAGPLQLAADQRIRFPAVKATRAQKQDVYLALPQIVDSQSADWTLIGVEPATLPEALAKSVGPGAPSIAYHVEREQFTAERRVFPDALRRAAVRLKFTQANVDAQGCWAGLSELIIQPGGFADWKIRLPHRSKLLHAEVDGRPILGFIGGDGLLSLPAGSRFLPRLVTIAYRLQESNEQRDLRLECPQVLQAGKPVGADNSLWQVHVAGERWRSAAGSGRAVTAYELRRLLREGRLSAVTDASSLALQLPGWEADVWFKPWLLRIETLPDGSIEGGAAREAAWTSLVERLVGAAAPAIPIVGHATLFPTDATRDPMACYEGGHEGGLTLITSPSRSTPGRWLVALALAGAWVAAFIYPRRAVPALKWSVRQPLIVGGVVGLSWWLLFWPSLLGLAIIGFALAAHLKLRQQRRRLRPTYSVARVKRHDKTVVDMAP